MKTLKLSATLMLLGSLTLCMAEANVDAQISAIKSATAQERVKLMNEFKTTLSTLSEEEREAAIQKLRASTGADGEQTKDRERARVNQMNEIQERQENQRMNQNQVGSQFMQQNPGVTPDAGTTPNRFMNR